MWGVPTIKRLNDEAAEAAEIMKRNGYEVPKIERSADAPPEVSEYYPLGTTPAERTACECAKGCEPSDADQTSCACV